MLSRVAGNCSSSTHTDYMSDYCKSSDYYGNLKPSLFKTVTDFAADTGSDFVWHLNMAFGRGYSKKYEPWKASDAKGLLETAGSALKGAMLFEEVKKSKVGFDLSANDISKDLKTMKDALPSDKTLVYGVLNQDSDQSPSDTDSDYHASKDSVDVVCYSYCASSRIEPSHCPHLPLTCRLTEGPALPRHEQRRHEQ